MRIGGLASGMDTEGIIKDMMRVEKMPLDKLHQEKQWLEWQQEDYREINQSLFSFRDKLFNLKLQGTFQSKGASSSNEDVVTVTAGNNATSGNYDLQVTHLAKGAFRTSTGKIGSEAEAFKFPTSSGELQINGTAINFGEDIDSFEKMAKRINEHEKDTGVRASYDKGTDRFYFSTTKTGSEAKIDFSGTKETGLDFLRTIKMEGMLEEGINGDDLDGSETIQKGQDAEIKLNGADLKMSTNQFTINGLTYDLKGTAPDNPTSIVVTNDTDAVFDKVKDFVDSYNELLEKINDKMGEKRYRSFHALSSEEKEALSDKEVELWEEKARSGTLRSDNTLRDLVSSLRMTVSSVTADTDSEYRSLRSIGIGTQNYFEGGKLHLDEEKLKEALNKSPDAVQNLFTAKSENGKSLGDKLYDTVNAGTEKVIKKAGRVSIAGIDNSALGQKLKNMEKSIASWETRLVKVEDRYWSQFTAMEKALAQMHSQSNWLFQQFS